MPVFLLANGRRVTLSRALVERVVTTRLSNCFSPQCYMSKEEYLACIEWITGRRSEAPGHARTCIYHMLFYSENLVLTNYMFLRSLRDPAAPEYLDSMLRLLEEIRRLAEEAYQHLAASRYSEAQRLAIEILDKLLRWGIDPW
ncbi:hypothetical protein [Pyrodictium abyssi]|uniref:HEPN domain-containing protein n=1 Tax=Pyrodictium abyssi TaxID=54256 RepID=A0ABM8ISW3_9CREN|nr:hypothetical protein PABY_02170 [Pyrodictium abyssi]